MKPVEEQIRKFPKGKDFTFIRNVDRLYAYLTTYSRYDNDGGHNYVLKSDVKVSEIAKALGFKTNSGIYKQIKKLVTAGFLEVLDDRYILRVDTPFVLISKGLLSKMFSLFQDDVINTYVYLVSKYEYFVNEQENKHFTFSQHQLLTEVYGRANQGYNHDYARNILDILYITGLIKIADYKEEINGGYYYVMTGYGTDFVGGLDELRQKSKKRLPNTKKENKAAKYNFG